MTGNRFDVLVIGGGVVGLWTALTASEQGWRVALCEKEPSLGTRTSRRNSGVLHTGLYYPPGSLKAEHCLAGRERTVRFLATHEIPHLLCGKLIVPDGSMRPSEAEDRLAALADNGRRNGVGNLEVVPVDSTRYPWLRGSHALVSGDTGIVDLPAYLSALQEVVCAAGVTLLPGHEFIEGEPGRVDLRQGDEGTLTLSAERIINCAGLHADGVAARFGLDRYEIRPNKGCYFRLRRPLPGARLVYPLPSTSSTHLGVHYATDIDGTPYLGPDSAWAENKEDYAATGDGEAFHASFDRIVRGYEPEDLQACDRVGLRARLFVDGGPEADFVIVERPQGVVHALGIESPGLTSAPSLARRLVADAMRSRP